MASSEQYPAKRTIYLCDGEELVRVVTVERALYAYRELQQANTTLTLWYRHAPEATWQWYYQGQHFWHFRVEHPDVKMAPQVLRMMDLLGAS